jgi:hypothetical protein
LEKDSRLELHWFVAFFALDWFALWHSLVIQLENSLHSSIRIDSPCPLIQWAACSVRALARELWHKWAMRVVSRRSCRDATAKPATCCSVTRSWPQLLVFCII